MNIGRILIMNGSCERSNSQGRTNEAAPGGNMMALHMCSSSFSFASTGSGYFSKPMQRMLRAVNELADCRCCKEISHHASSDGHQILQRGSALRMVRFDVTEIVSNELRKFAQKKKQQMHSTHVLSTAPSQKSGGLMPSRNAARCRTRYLNKGFNERARIEIEPDYK